MRTVELSRREMLRRAAKIGVALWAAQSAGMAGVAWAAKPAVGVSALDEIDGFATSATVHRDELLLAIQTHGGPHLFGRGLSPDSTWRSVAAVEAFPSGAYIRSLVSYGGQLLALGTRSVSLGSVEFVIDDDQSYSNPEDPDIRPLPPGTVIREERRSIEPLLAASANLVEWKPIEGTGVEHGSFAGGFTVAGKLLLIGELFDSPTFSADSIGALLIASADLTAWEPLALPEKAQSRHGHFPGVAGVPAGGGLVVASDLRGKRLLETSDGLHWTASTLPGSVSLQPLGVASVPGGVVVAGVDGDGIRAWVRSGPTWRELGVSSRGHLFGLTAMGAQLLLLGANPDHTPLVAVNGGEG